MAQPLAESRGLILEDGHDGHGRATLRLNEESGENVECQRAGEGCDRKAASAARSRQERGSEGRCGCR
jgi:hypothetical protein